MIYLKRIIIGLSFLLVFIVYPVELVIRYKYNTSGKDPHKQTWAYKLINKYSQQC